MDDTSRFNILVVEDDRHMASFIAQRLEGDGHTTTVVTNGASAIDSAGSADLGLIVLDVGLPGIDGFEVSQQIREFSQVPIISLTGYAETTIKLRGFEAGADDYIVKPFNSDELLARIHAVMRRARQAELDPAVDGEILAGELQILDNQHRVLVRGAEIHLTGMEYKLVRQLALCADRVVDHSGLLSTAWGPQYASDLGYLHVYIRRLREKLELDPLHPSLIRTVQGVGYMLFTETD